MEYTKRKTSTGKRVQIPSLGLISLSQATDWILPGLMRLFCLHCYSLKTFYLLKSSVDYGFFRQCSFILHTVLLAVEPTFGSVRKWDLKAVEIVIFLQLFWLSRAWILKFLTCLIGRGWGVGGERWGWGEIGGGEKLVQVLEVRPCFSSWYLQTVNPAHK